MDVALAGGDRADCADDLRVRRLLQHVPARARLERLPDVAGVVLHREDEHLRLRHRLQHRRHALDARLAGHDDVHDDHVRLARERLEHGAVGVLGLADDLDVVLGLEHTPQPERRIAWSSTRTTRMLMRSLACQAAPRPTSVVARCLRLDSTVRRATDEREPFAHPGEAERLRRGSPSGSKPRPSSSTTTTADPSLRIERDADTTRVGVLDDVRQRLLHDAVERGLDSRRAGAPRRAGPRGRPRGPTARRRSPRAARARARARSRRARSVAARPPAAGRSGASRRRARGATATRPRPRRRRPRPRGVFRPSRIEASA